MSRQATKPFLHSEGAQLLFLFALRLLVVFIENIRDSIEIQNGGLLHSSLSKRWIIEYKGTLFFYIFVFFPTFFCNFAANLDKYRYFDDGIFLKQDMDFPKNDIL